MKIKLLKKDYKKDEQLFSAFVSGAILTDETFFSDEFVEIPDAPDFPVYIGRGSDEEKRQAFFQAFAIMRESYIELERDILFNERFWHSLLVTEMRSYVLENYPECTSSLAKFKNIVLKKFDWENYIYKCLVAVDYIESADILYLEKDRYYELVFENLDVFNYIIKYPVFRNDIFLIKVLTVIDELDISSIMKARIKDRPDLGKDERYGRRVIFEMNKNYPVVMAPLMDIDTLKAQCIDALALYDIHLAVESPV